MNNAPYVKEYLDRVLSTIDRSRAAYKRTLAFRIDLTLPYWMDKTPTDNPMEKFIGSVRSKIKSREKAIYKSKGKVHKTSIRFVWAKEFGKEGKAHFHLLLLISKEVYMSPGKPGSEQRDLFRILQEGWASALNVPWSSVVGQVHLTDGLGFVIYQDYSDIKTVRALFRSASYLCKAYSKGYGDRKRSFGYSSI